MNKTTALGGLVAALVLSACGGGGDDVAPPAPKPPATVVTGVEGLWTGATTDPLNVQGVVDLFGDARHLQVIGFDHGGDADR